MLLLNFFSSTINQVFYFYLIRSSAASLEAETQCLEHVVEGPERADDQETSQPSHRARPELFHE